MLPVSPGWPRGARREAPVAEAVAARRTGADEQTKPPLPHPHRPPPGARVTITAAVKSRTRPWARRAGQTPADGTRRAGGAGGGTGPPR